MPIRIQNDLSVKAVLEQENIFVMDKKRTVLQDIRPLQILILNPAPFKEGAELRLLHALSNTPLQVDCTSLMTSSYEATHTSKSHISSFYVLFGEVRHRHFDGLIITEVPVESLPYGEMGHWEELCGITEWSRTHMTPTFHICWGAQAGPYYHYGIQKYPRKEKLSDVYCHKMLHRSTPLVRSMDDYMGCPYSRWIEMWREDIVKHPELTILAGSDEADTFLLADKTGRQIFVQGHPEYDRMTLDSEYQRDKAWGTKPKIPLHYYENDNPSDRLLFSRRNMANTFYTNWLNYYVYQVTPYLLEEGEEP